MLCVCVSAPFITIDKINLEIRKNPLSVMGYKLSPNFISSKKKSVMISINQWILDLALKSPRGSMVALRGPL